MAAGTVALALLGIILSLPRGETARPSARETVSGNLWTEGREALEFVNSWDICKVH